MSPIQYTEDAAVEATVLLICECLLMQLNGVIDQEQAANTALELCIPVGFGGPMAE